MYKILFIFHGAAKVVRQTVWLKAFVSVIIFLLISLFLTGCLGSDKEEDWHHADFYVIDKRGFEIRTARLEDKKLLRRLNRLAVSNLPERICPIDRVIRFTADDGSIWTLPLSLCEGNEHVYTRHERTWAAWRIDPRLLPTLDSLFSINQGN